jgi:hypothetical protein
MQAFCCSVNISKQKITCNILCWLDDTTIDSKEAYSIHNVKLSRYPLLSQHNQVEKCGELQNKNKKTYSKG